MKWVDVDQDRADIWRWPSEPGGQDSVLEGACLGRREAQTRFGVVPAYDFILPDGRKVTLFARGHLDKLLSLVLRAKGQNVLTRVRFDEWIDTGGGRRKRHFVVSYSAD